MLQASAAVGAQSPPLLWPRLGVVAQPGGPGGGHPLEVQAVDGGPVLGAGRDHRLVGLVVVAGAAEQLQVGGVPGVAVDVVDLVSGGAAGTAAVSVSFQHLAANVGWQPAGPVGVAGPEHERDPGVQGLLDVGVGDASVALDAPPVPQVLRGLRAPLGAEQPRVGFR